MFSLLWGYSTQKIRFDVTFSIFVDKCPEAYGWVEENKKSFLVVMMMMMMMMVFKLMNCWFVMLFNFVLYCAFCYSKLFLDSWSKNSRSRERAKSKKPPQVACMFGGNRILCKHAKLPPVKPLSRPIWLFSIQIYLQSCVQSSLIPLSCSC